MELNDYLKQGYKYNKVSFVEPMLVYHINGEVSLYNIMSDGSQEYVWTRRKGDYGGHKPGICHPITYADPFTHTSITLCNKIPYVPFRNDYDEAIAWGDRD